jgi:hypothetical protein
MGFGDSFMDFAHGWNRKVSGVGHEIAGGAKYLWNGGSILDPDKQPSVDDSDCLIGRIEGGQEYYYGEDLSSSGGQLMGKGISGMGGAVWDGITGLFTGDSSGDVGAGGVGGGAPSTGGGGAGGGAATDAYQMWTD